MGGLAVVIAGIAYMLVVPGRPRMRAKFASAASCCSVRRLLRDLPRDRPLHRRGRSAVILGVSIPVALFRAFVA